MPRLQSVPPVTRNRSLLDTRLLSSEEIVFLFAQSSELEKLANIHGNFYDPATSFSRKTVFCLFLEPSTRTRLSFEMAAHRLGHRVVLLDVGSGSSRAKGETDVDTVLNVLAMNPDLLVIRYNRSPELDELLPSIEVPIISGGNATSAHPTQALLDAFTIFREKNHTENLRGERVLIVGDIRHSRVARSNFDVLLKLGAEVGVCGPKAWLPDQDEIKGIRIFHNLDEAMSWPSVFMGLRVQIERHEDSEEDSNSMRDFNDQYGLNKERLKLLSSEALILHPGPINHGVEFTKEVLLDPRSRVLKQVSNGVLIRAALLADFLGARKLGK